MANSPCQYCLNEGHVHYPADHERKVGICGIIPTDPNEYVDRCPRYVPSDGDLYRDNLAPSVIPQDYSYQGGYPLSPVQVNIEGYYKVGAALVDPGFKYLWGGPDPLVGSARSPRYNVLYNAYGWDGTVSNKRIYKKTTKFFVNRGIPSWVISAFQNYSSAYTWDLPEHQGQLGRDIDDVFDERLSAFRACGPGTWQWNAANNVNPSSLTINFHGIPFDVGAGVWVAGAMYGDQNRIEALTVFVNNYVPGGNPANADMTVTAPKILKWEIGNYIAYKGGYRPNQTPRNDLGSNNPCLCSNPSGGNCFNNG